MNDEEVFKKLQGIEELQRKDKEAAYKHIATFNGEMGAVKTDIKWLKRISWGILGGIGTALIGIIVVIAQNALTR